MPDFYFSQEICAMNPFLSELLHTTSVSGFTDDAGRVIENYARTWAENVSRDPVGNILVKENSAEGGLMLSAHMDEIGLMVSYILPDGKLCVYKVGGIYIPMYFGHIVRVHTRSGVLYGSVSVCKEIYQPDAKATDIIVDIGAESREEAASLVSVGDMVTFDSDYREQLHNQVCARALDDKSGVYVIMEALRRAKKMGLKTSATAAATVGEETTKNGACWAAARVKPRLAFVVDGTYTCDYAHGSKKEEYGEVRLGKGPVIAINPIITRDNIGKITRIAQKHNIPLQFEPAATVTYTDADRIHYSGGGVEVVLVSVPMRYMHSACETINLNDLETCADLLAYCLLEWDND